MVSLPSVLPSHHQCLCQATAINVVVLDSPLLLVLLSYDLAVRLYIFKRRSSFMCLSDSLLRSDILAIQILSVSLNGI